MLGKILDFMCTRLRSTEIALDSLSLVQYDFCRTKTRANKIPYFTKHCRITYYYSDDQELVQSEPNCFPRIKIGRFFKENWAFCFDYSAYLFVKHVYALYNNTCNTCPFKGGDFCVVLT